MGGSLYHRSDLRASDRPDRTPDGVVAVIRDGPRCLLIRRGEATRAPGFWCFPGGALEPGEDERKALVREVREELGLEVEPTRHLARRVTAWGVDLAWWEARIVGPSPDGPLVLDPREVAEARWVTPEEALALEDLLGSNVELLETLAGAPGCAEAENRSDGAGPALRPLPR